MMVEAGGTDALQKIGGIMRKENYVATSQDISREVKAWEEMDLPNGQRPKHTAKMLHDEKVMAETKTFIAIMGENTVGLVKNTAMALLHKVFNCRVVDCNLALAYCSLLPKKDVFEKLWTVINNTWQNYSKVLAIAVVGAQLALVYLEDEERIKFRELITDAEWGIQLSNIGISFQSAFRQNSGEKKELISTLVQNSRVDTALILKYCSTFMLDSDAALQLYIETLLLSGSSWKNSHDDCVVDANEHSKLVAKAKQIIPLLNSTQDLVVSLSGILHKLDPYDFETIEGTLQVILAADEKNTNIPLTQALSLVNLLKSYNRIASPADLEHQYILAHGISMSSAAHRRLPFHLLFFTTSSSFWGIISAELSEESFPTLLLISKLMKFCIFSRVTGEIGPQKLLSNRAVLVRSDGCRGSVRSLHSSSDDVLFLSSRCGSGPVEGRAKYCSAQAPGKVREAHRLSTPVLCSALNRADKVRLHRSRSVKTRRGHHLMKNGGAGPNHNIHRTGPGPPLGYIGGLSTAFQNAVDKPLMLVGLAHLRFWG
ncbi:unnamed protein product [Ranitomeya imitator]|uniref:Uncharacterized protein n=1 Tax=Ranitomeya imitator TaxID=111125 RepID=A0ABN9M4G8_9NEOB|nr:unnamed protein product [Ranitomeya imitator]